MLPPPMPKPCKDYAAPIGSGLKLKDCRVGMRIRNTNYSQNGEGTITSVLIPDKTIEVMWDVMGRIKHDPSALQYFTPVSSGDKKEPRTWMGYVAYLVLCALGTFLVAYLGNNGHHVLAWLIALGWFPLGVYFLRRFVLSRSKFLST